jgi:hypothetical protein
MMLNGLPSHCSSVYTHIDNRNGIDLKNAKTIHQNMASLLESDKVISADIYESI